MADFLTPSERSQRMSSIRSRDTKPEVKLRRALHRLGLRFRLHGDLPGRPDLVFPRHRAVVLVHGCFWHRHAGCKVASTPKSNTGFWQAKFDRNVRRDAEMAARLEALGWKVMVAWECELGSRAKVEAVACCLASQIDPSRHAADGGHRG